MLWKVRTLASLGLAVLFVLEGFCHAVPPAQAAPTTQAAPTPPPPGLTIGLDIMVRQAAGAAGFQVSALESQVDESTFQGSATRWAGSGRWQVSVLAEQESLVLAGTLQFEMTGQLENGMLTGMAASIKGPLSAENVELVVDATQSSQVSADALDSMNDTKLRLTRDGQAVEMRIAYTSQTRRLAYQVIGTSTTMTLERDGQQATWTNTLQTRRVDDLQAEVWLHSVLSLEQGSPLTADAHFFQRLRGGGVNQYYDQLEVQLFGEDYALQAPAAASIDAAGNLQSEIVLLNSRGEPVTTPVARGVGVLRAPLYGPCDDEANAIMGWALGNLTTVAWAVLLGLLAGNPITLGLVAWGLLGNVLISLMSYVLSAYGVRPNDSAVAWAVHVGLRIALGFSLGGMAAGGAGAASGVAGRVIGWLFGMGVVPLLTGHVEDLLGAIVPACHADPYFVYAVERPGAAAGGPVYIVSISGGLVPLLPAAGQPSPPGLPPGGDRDYDDRPEAFVNGALPAEAVAVGDWQWDAARPFGAAASHSAAGHGPHKHYFIHAAPALQLGPDDNLIQYVYLDPTAPPAEIYLQFYTGDGSGEHRVTWGADRVQTGGQAGTSSLYPMGALPPTGGWVRLKVPTDVLGLSGATVHGILYGSHDGQVWWGATTASSRLTDRAPAALPVEVPLPLPAVLPGAQIAYQVDEPSRLSAVVLDGQGAVVRTLLPEQDVAAGYRALTWDGADDQGKQLPDVPYQVRFSAGGQTVAEAGVSLSPLVARIQMPAPYSLVRGTDVPVIGEAYGSQFDHYVVEYGAGAAPSEWHEITSAASPVLLAAARPAAINRIGNLANWNVGLDEYQPFDTPGLSGLYTLRLRVVGKDGREAAHSVPVVVGRLAHSAEGGIIVSPDGKARLLVPPLAILTSFSILALLPLNSSEQAGLALPRDRQLAGPMYELMPSDEVFRRPATLELPYDTANPAEKIGVLVGDGHDWRYLGGQADPARGVVSAPLSEFGGARTFAAAFRADEFGAPQPLRTPAGPLAFEPDAPTVACATHPAAFTYDFASTGWEGEVTALDQFGTQLTRVRGAEAGLPGDAAALKVERLPEGERMVQLRATPYDAARYPILGFDYRLPAGDAPNLLLRSNGKWWQLRTGTLGTANSRYYQTLKAPALIADGAWHHYQIDVWSWLRANLPASPPPSSQIETIVLGQVESGPFMQVIPVDSGGAEAYYITNVAALAPVSNVQPDCTLSEPGGVRYAGTSVVMDQDSATVPATQDQGPAPGLALPPGGSDGLWYLHARGRTTDGRWSATAHYPMLIDRQPPVPGQPFPLPDGAGVPGAISLPVSDAGGVDLSTLRFSLNGRTYGAGDGVSYLPDEGALRIWPYYLQPPPAPVANGQPVEVAVTALADYAGNGLVAPLGWRFTADQVQASGEEWRALTVDGEAPALSPDGSQLAFVSSRSGSPKIWIMRSDDYEEKASSARRLTADGSMAGEADPAWSPGGTSLAYVSETNGAPQLWVAGSDGSGAHPLTPPVLGSTLASPTWSPGGRFVAFIRDGNVWQVDVEGSAPRAATQVPDRPYQSASWQPGGQLLALGFNLYEQRIELYDMASGGVRLLTHGGRESQAAWLNPQTVLYTAPAGAGRPDAVWQVNQEGSDPAVMPGSGQPGVADMQAASAADGSALAMVSTRSGKRAIWVQRVLQIARFGVEPPDGAPAGEPLQISYILPADAHVTLQVFRADGSLARVLLDRASQAKGPQSVSWDGNDSSGRPLPPATYRLELTVQPASGSPLERFAGARILDASSVGSLQIQVQQWAGRPVEPFGGQVRIYAAGSRAASVAQADATNSPTFKLPAGRYDAVVVLPDMQREESGITVEAGKTASHTIDLGLGQLKVAILSAPGEAIGGDASVRVTPDHDPYGASAHYAAGRAADFLLPPGRYDVLAEFQGLGQTVYGVEVVAGQVTQRDLNLGSGLVRLNVSAYAGKLLEAGWLSVEAFRPGDHTQPVGQPSYANPAELRLPAGVYDLRISAFVSTDLARVNGRIEQWLPGIEVKPGETVAQDYTMHLGQIQVQVLEATGKPADEKLLTTFCVVGPGERDCARALAIVYALNTAQLWLPAGSYGLIADYQNTELRSLGPVDAPLEVREGQSLSQSVNLKLGRIRVQVMDASGQPVDFGRLWIKAYLPGPPEARVLFANVQNAAPVDLVLQAGVSYDLEIVLDQSKRLVLTGQSVQEGETPTLTVGEAAFK